MAKFCGDVGYAEPVETSPGVWAEKITPRKHRGDIIRMSSFEKSVQEVNQDILLNNQISIIADPYAYNNFYAIRYVKWMNTKWKVTHVEVQRPRLLLTLGGVYNGE